MCVETGLSISLSLSPIHSLILRLSLSCVRARARPLSFARSLALSGNTPGFTSVVPRSARAPGPRRRFATCIFLREQKRKEQEERKQDRDLQLAFFLREKRRKGQHPLRAHSIYFFLFLREKKRKRNTGHEDFGCYICVWAGTCAYGCI